MMHFFKLRSRYVIITVALLLLLGTGGTAMAENGWGLLASYWSTSDVGDGPGIGGKISFNLLPWVLWDLRATWYDDLGEGDLELGVVPWETGVSFVGNASEDFEYFGGLGAGYYTFDANIVPSVGDATDLDPENELGLYVNAGVEYTVSRNVESIGATRATLFLEIMYRSVEVKELNVSGVTLRPEDASLSGPSVNFGFMLRW